ncbi:MAG: hypothetical protein IPK04_13000 [Bdellovibrionales bacterium]|nr:hypothetical protein [Bdellovibrionales bacterium]
MKTNLKPNPKFFLVAVLLIFSQAVQAGTIPNIFLSTKAEGNAADKVEEFRWKEINYIVRPLNPTTDKLCKFSRLNWTIGYELSGLLRHYFVTKILSRWRYFLGSRPNLLNKEMPSLTKFHMAGESHIAIMNGMHILRTYICLCSSL